MPKPGNGGGGNGGGGGGSGGSTWRGGNGADTAIVLTADQLATTTYDGRGGSDTLDMSALSTGVTISINDRAGSSSTVYPNREFTGLYHSMSLVEPDGRLTGTIKSIENLIGGSRDDFLFIQSSGANTINGGGGDDALGSNGGNTTMIGGTGSDVMLVYWAGNILVGGTYADGVATPDLESDTFIFGGSGTILDFEVGIDRLQFETSPDRIPVILATDWQDTANGAILQVEGRTITLAGVTAAEASTIQIEFVVSQLGTDITDLSGGAGDDTFYAFSDAEQFILANGSGHDTILFFDTAEDSLVFSDGGPALWEQVDVNGEVALRGYYDDGNSSVTLLGLTVDDISALMFSPAASLESPSLGNEDWPII